MTHRLLSLDLTRIILAVLFGWGSMTFGFQFLQKLLATEPDGENVFTRFSFFNLPLNVWFTAQFLPLREAELCGDEPATFCQQTTTPPAWRQTKKEVRDNAHHD